jgi:hypothetical protein
VADNAPLFGTIPFMIDVYVVDRMYATYSGKSNIIIAYRQATSEGGELLSSDGPFIHIGEMNLPPSQFNSSEFCIHTSRFERCFNNQIQGIRSMIVTGTGNFSLHASIDGICYQPIFPGGSIAIDIPSTPSFINTLSFGPGPSASRSAPLATTVIVTGSGRFSGSATLITQSSAETRSVASFDTNSRNPTFIRPAAAQVGQSEGSKSVLISLGTLIAGALFINAGAVLLLAYRRKALMRPTYERDAESDLPDDALSSTAEMEVFLSGENVLTQDRYGSIPNAFEQEDADENFLAGFRKSSIQQLTTATFSIFTVSPLASPLPIPVRAITTERAARGNPKA